MSGGRVLVVEDDPQLAALYAELLADTYETESVTSGVAALEAMDASVDVVLLDRRMPDKSGDEVLAEIRSRGFECPVIMVSAINPDLDILDMPFTEYLTKPISGADLHAAIDRALTLAQRNSDRLEYFMLLDKYLALAANAAVDGLCRNEEYLALRQRLEVLTDEELSSMDACEQALAAALVKKWPGVDPGLEIGV